MERKSFDNKWLVGILCGFVVLIIGLIVGITVVGVNSSNDVELKSLREGEDDGPTVEQKAKMLEIVDVYDGGDHDKAMYLYDSELASAVVGEDFDYYLDMFDSRFETLANNGKCDEAFSYVDDFDSSTLPIWKLKELYERAAVNAVEKCKNTDKEEEYLAIAESLSSLISDVDIEDENVDNNTEEENAL